MRGSCALPKNSVDRLIGDQLPGLHEERAVGDASRELHLVGDEDHRGSGLGEPLDDRQHLRGHLRIERRGHLVEEQMPRLHGKRAADPDPLLLAAGELRRIGVGPVGKPDHRQELARLRLGRLRAGRFSATVGASVMLASTVRCG